MVSSIILTGCANKEPEVVIVKEPINVYIPTKCNIPEPICNNTKFTDTELITEMRLCINRYREVYHSCNGSNSK